MRKRRSNDSSPESKRAKKKVDRNQAKLFDEIDAIPFRSTAATSLSTSASVTGSFGQQKFLSYFQNAVGITTSFSTSSTSENTSFSSASGSNSPLDDDDGSEYYTSQESPSESEKEVTDICLLPETLENRLKGIWAQFVNETFNEAPLAVVWEITRIALHCEVEPAGFNVLYQDISHWNTQPSLRDSLSKLPAFKAKDMPQFSSHDAWDLAMKEFQSETTVVSLSAELMVNQSSTGPLFSLKLSPLCLEQGHRLSRRFGADRFLEILMPYPSQVQKEAQNKHDLDLTDAIVRWLVGRKHYFLGRRWSAFYCKPGSKRKGSRKNTKAVQQVRVFLFASEGDIFRRPLEDSLPPIAEARTPRSRTTVKVRKMIDWAIGGLGTTNQQVPKLFSRISLSLTLTYATVEIERHQIHESDNDIGSHSPMNDGIGRMSRALAMKIASVLGLTELPSAFQARLGSAKGMWIIDGDPSSGDDIWIVTYPSQRKWDCDNEDIHHRTFEVLEWSKEPRSASLNQQFIPVLEAQAIKPSKMRTVIAAHLARGLLEDFAAQETAMEDPVELRLWLQQGIGSKSGGNEDTVLFQGALPRELAKRAAVLLDSGFHPKTCKFLQDQCRAMAKQRADFLKDKMNICVPCSAYLLMVVDFSSTLEEDEVHVSFSTKFKVDGFCDTLLEGMDVLVARAPSHLPSDIQRVKVVSKPQLRQLKDVVVFSTKGRSSLADKLSGGDYDGDRAWVCWDQDIVQNFRNAAMPEDDTDPVKLGYIHKLERSMAQIRKEETNEDSVCAKFLYEAFSFNMEPSLLGICTDYKERYSYYLGDVGNNNKNILILSRALGCLVDQPKQGYIFSFLDWDQFRKALHMPRYLPEPDYKLPRPTNESPKRAPLHILDYLRHRVAEDTTNNALTAFNKLLDSYQAHSYDAHLTKLFNDIDERNRTNTTWVRIRKVLNEDIESVRDLWSTQFIREMGGGDFVNAVEPIYRKWCQIQPLATERSSDLAQYLLQPWMINRQSTLWELLKASYTFKKFHTRQAFTWQIAGRQLAMLKPFMSHVSTANACILVVPQLYSVLKPDKKVIAARRLQRLAKTDMAHVSANDLQARGFGHDNADIDEEEDM